MNKPVPLGWVDLQLLNSSGNPWQGVPVKNGQISTTDKHGKMRLHVNGGSIDANGVPIKKLIQSVSGAKEVILQFNSNTGGFRVIDPKTKDR